MSNRQNLVVAVFAFPICLLCQTAPVPKRWLHDGRLVVSEFNFSIDSPSPDSKWSYKGDLPKVDGNGSTAFIAEAGEGIRYVVLVTENVGKMTSTTPDQFAIGMRKTLPKDWQIRDSRLEASDVPLKDSRKFKVTIELPNGSTYFAYGYIVPGNRGYQTITFSPSPSEPRRFTHFVQSFALLHATANTPPPNSSGIFLVWALWGALVDWRYIRRGGIRSSRNDKLGLLAAVGLGLALIVFLGFRGASAESLGSLTATIGILIFSLWEFARWRVRRRTPAFVKSFHETKPQMNGYPESELEAVRPQSAVDPER
jgi:hypothetical protein